MIQGIIEILTDASPVTTLVGRKSTIPTEWKIFPVKAAQGEKTPYIIAAKTPSEPLQMKRDVSDLDRANFQLIIYADDYESIDNMHEACRAALDQMTSITDNGINFVAIWFTGDYDTFDEKAEKMCRVANYSAQHKRT